MFGDKLPGPSRGAEKNYACLTVADICAFPLPVLADDGILLLWRVSAMVEEAMRVVRAWGFEPKSEIVWVKTKKDGDVDAPEPPLSFGMGRYVRASHETCIVAARGRAASLVEDRAVRSVFYAPRGEHSEKPAAFYALAERLVKTGKRVELFARRVRPGWEGYGDQLPGRPAHPAQRAA
jgi:N6-adenosine-specific RNA methylase IME4